MKKILGILFILLCVNGYAQTRVDSVAIESQILQLKGAWRWPHLDTTSVPILEFHVTDSLGVTRKISIRPPVSLQHDWTLMLPVDSASAGEVLTAASADSFYWSTPAGSGDITRVIAGSGLSGGGLSGDVTLDINPKLVGQTIEILSDSIQVKDASITQGKLVIGSGAGDASTTTLHDFINNSPSTNYVIKWNGSAWTSAAESGGGGSSIVLDLGNDASNESTGITKITTVNDTKSVMTEPNPDEVRFNLGVSWPVADSALTVTSGLITNAMVNASANIGSTKLASNVMVESENISLLTNDANYQADSDTSVWDATRAWVISQNYLVSETGDIESVTAGSGLVGGGTSGAVSLDLLLETDGGLSVVSDSLRIKLNGATLALTSAGLAVNSVAGVTGADEDNVTLADVQAATSSDFHNIGGTDDDVPESGDFGNAADLESTGALSIDVVAPAEMADADHGDVSWSGGVATVDNVNNTALDADLQTLAAPTNWQVFYSNGLGVIVELGLGAAGTVLKSNGASSAPSWQSDATGAGGSAYADSVVHDGRRVTGDSLITDAEGDARFQPLEATLTDIADGTIAEDLVNTANPWANNEIADLPASKITSGTFLHERGGLEADVSAYNGLVRIASGATSNVTNLSGLNTAIGASIADGAHTTDTGDEVLVDGGATVNPDLVSTGDIDVVNTSNTITFNLNAGAIVNADVNASAAIAASKLDANLIESSEINTYSELNAIVADVTLTSNDLIDTSSELLAILTDETGTGALVFGTNPVLAGATVNGGNLAMSDGVGDTPRIAFTPQTGTAWDIYAEDTGDDLQIEVNTASTETVDFVNAGAGVVDVNIDGSLTAGNFSGTSSGTNTGDQTITLTGDVTGSGTGSFATTIANNAVTNAKANDMAQNTIKMRVAAGSGDPEDIDISAGLSEDATPAAGDWLLGENAAGNIVKYDVGNLPAGAETDPTLTDNAAVTIGDNTSGDVTLTFDGDAGTDGKIKYDVSADAFVIDAPASIPADGDLANGQFSIWIDAAGNELETKFKDSAGDVTQGAFTLLGNSSTGSGAVALANTPVFTTPNIADFSNAGHDHLDAAGGAQLSGAFLSGAITFPDGTRQTFNPDATTPGFNVGSQAGDPSTPSNGDIWYNSSTNKFRAYENGSLTDLISAGGSSEWTDTGTTLHPTETGDEVVLGASSPVSSSKLSIDGDADQIQFLVQGNATQTSALMILENSAGTDQFTVSNTGDGVFTGTVDAAGGDLSGGTVTLGTVSGAIDAGGATSLELPNGAGGTTVDAQGEVTVDATSGTLNYHDGTAERAISPIKQVTFTVENPGASEDIFGAYIDDASTVTKIVAVLVGSSTPSVTWTVRHSTDRSAAGNEVVTSGTTTTSITTGSVVTSFNDATVPADSFLWLETTAQSGTVDMIAITVFYRQDP